MFSGTGFKDHILLIAALFSMASINLSYADGGASTNPPLDPDRGIRKHLPDREDYGLIHICARRYPDCNF